MTSTSENAGGNTGAKVDVQRMVTIEDRAAKFGPGPWQDEPDRIEWRNEGFPCLMIRHPSMGHWCGYVGVEPGHPWHGSQDDSIADVHGGITYSKECAGSVCHVPQPGEPEHVWWLGFDCAHSGDLSPCSLVHFGAHHGVDRETYRDERYVRAQTEALAKQALAARAGT